MLKNFLIASFIWSVMVFVLFLVWFLYVMGFDLWTVISTGVYSPDMQQALINRGDNVINWIFTKGGWWQLTIGFILSWWYFTKRAIRSSKIRKRDVNEENNTVVGDIGHYR